MRLSVVALIELDAVERKTPTNRPGLNAERLNQTELKGKRNSDNIITAINRLSYLGGCRMLVVGRCRRMLAGGGAERAQR